MKNKLYLFLAFLLLLTGCGKKKPVTFEEYISSGSALVMYIIDPEDLYEYHDKKIDIMVFNRYNGYTQMSFYELSNYSKNHVVDEQLYSDDDDFDEDEEYERLNGEGITFPKKRLFDFLDKFLFVNKQDKMSKLNRHLGSAWLNGELDDDVLYDEEFYHFPVDNFRRSETNYDSEGNLESVLFTYDVQLWNQKMNLDGFVPKVDIREDTIELLPEPFEVTLDYEGYSRSWSVDEVRFKGFMGTDGKAYLFEMDEEEDIDLVLN